MKNKILITKDILRSDYLSCYGGGGYVWNTPNIDELAKKGTKFLRHYTSASSTAMVITSMFTGKYPFETDRKKYIEVKQFNDNDTLFDVFIKKGLKTFVIWPFEWNELAYKYSKVFHKDTEVINVKDFSQNIIRNSNMKIKTSNELANKTLANIITSIDNILLNNEKIFIWIHLPHVIKGRTSYGSDIDLFDKLVGEIRKRFDDNSIYISADHGHMNIDKGIPVYGFHVYEVVIKIPLITPRIDKLKVVNFPTSNTQLKEIILNGKIERKEYIYSDTQYYLQENRKLAIIKDNYKYIYNKRTNTEELYDLDFDPNENVNLLIEKFYDRNRYGYYNLNEIYYYPYWDKIESIYKELKEEKNRIWKQGSWLLETAHKLNNYRKIGFKNIYNYLNSRKKITGHFNSLVKNQFYEK